MAHQKLSDVVILSEGMRPHVGIPRDGSSTAADYLVSRMFTDAIFNEDIRTIQLIVNRIDGGLQKDTDMNQYQTEFTNCFNQIMQMPSAQQLKVLPDDTVMMAMCKALYALSVQDIYWDAENGVRKRPSTDKKQERDNALRMVLERTGGRKTTPIAQSETREVKEASWITDIRAQLPEK